MVCGGSGVTRMQTGRKSCGQPELGTSCVEFSNGTWRTTPHNHSVATEEWVHVMSIHLQFTNSNIYFHMGES